MKTGQLLHELAILGAFLLLQKSMINDTRARSTYTQNVESSNVRVNQRIIFYIFFSLQKMFILLTSLFCDFDWRIACNNAIEINRTFLLLFFLSARIHNKSLWFSCPFDHFHSIFFGDTTNSYEIIKINFHCRTSIGFSIFFATF